jgi:arsenate reductase (glutaredoxin)
MITLFGIPNCDTVKKARAWLTAQGLDYQFHDFKKQGVPVERLDTWLAAVGWEKLLNASLIKRPVVEWADSPSAADISVGFDAENWSKRV